MSNDTICTPEQPCGLSNCEYCDPFADGGKREAHKVGELPPQADPYENPPSGVGTFVNCTASNNTGSLGIAQSESAIPSLSDCYDNMTLRYTEYEGKLAELALAENDVTEDRIALEQEKTNVLLRYTDPKELGSNEAQRAAAIAFHTSLHTQKLQASQRSVELLKCEVEIARLRCRLADNTLRFCEARIMDNNREED